MTYQLQLNQHSLLLILNVLKNQLDVSNVYSLCYLFSNTKYKIIMYDCPAS